MDVSALAAGVHRFRVNAPRLGLDKNNLEIYGDVAAVDGQDGLWRVRGTCMETWVMPKGQTGRRSVPFSHNLIHGQVSVPACPGVLVRVRLPVAP